MASNGMRKEPLEGHHKYRKVRNINERLFCLFEPVGEPAGFF